MIRIFVTGGTFDKTYDEIRGQLSFRDTHLHEMLRLGRSRADVAIRTLMMIDSLQMTNADRELVVEAVSFGQGKATADTVRAMQTIEDIAEQFHAAADSM